jgi:hypothetical protein
MFIGYATAVNPKYAIVSIIEHGAVLAHPHVANARDILRFCQQRDPARLPAAWPMTSAAAEPAPTPGRQTSLGQDAVTGTAFRSGG